MSSSVEYLDMGGTSPPPCAYNDVDEPVSIFSHSDSETQSLGGKYFVLPTIKNHRDKSGLIVRSECFSIKKKCVVARFHSEPVWRSRIGVNADKETLSCRGSHIDIASAQLKSSSTPAMTFPGKEMEDDVISSLVRELELNYPRPSISSQASSIYDPVRFLRDPDSCDPPKSYSRKNRKP